MPDGSPEQLESMVEMQLASASPETAVRLREAIDGLDVGDLLAGIGVPTLVIHARGDAIYPLEQGRKLASAIPGAEFLVLESRNHVILPQDPAWQQLIAAIAGFAAG
ncbi:MAG: alpha/beta fold hydrolase [Paracoccaceae bacterium]